MHSNYQVSSNSDEQPSGNIDNSMDTRPNWSLDWDLRVQYFAGFFCLSIVASFCGTSLLYMGKLTGFSVLTSLSSILSLLGTCFLCGPISQCQKMFHKSRWLASSLYILAIAATLVAGLVIKNPPLAIVCIILQYVAMGWYSLSYIPYARDFVSRLLCSCF